MRIRVKELAKKKNKTYKQIAEGIDSTERTLYRWNSGEISASKASLEKLARFFKCKASDLIEF